MVYVDERFPKIKVLTVCYELNQAHLTVIDVEQGLDVAIKLLKGSAFRMRLVRMILDGALCPACVQTTTAALNAITIGLEYEKERQEDAKSFSCEPDEGWIDLLFGKASKKPDAEQDIDDEIEVEEWIKWMKKFLDDEG